MEVRIRTDPLRFLGGVLTGLAFYFPILAPFSFLSLLPLYFGRGLRDYLVYGFGFSLGATFPLLKAALIIAEVGAGNLPIYYLIAAFGGLLLYLSVVFGFALYQFGLTWLLNRFVRFLPLSYTLVELVRERFFFDEMPYFLLGHLWGYFGFLNLSYRWFPVWFFTFLTLSVSYLLYLGYKRAGWKTFFLPYIPFLLLGITSYLALRKVSYTLPNFPITVIQPFFKQNDKLENQKLLLPYLELLLVKAPKEGLTVLPETVLDYGENPEEFVKTFSDRDLLFGVQRLTYDERRKEVLALNEVILAEHGKIKGVYIKNYPVPFGEYTPKGFNLLGKLFHYFEGVDYAFGRGFKTFDYRGFRISPLVCNEVFYLPDLKGELITVHSNDAWFFGPFVNYHRLLAKIEAIKTSKVVLFVNNNGGSALILPDGVVYGCGDRRVCSLVYQTAKEVSEEGK